MKKILVFLIILSIFPFYPSSAYAQEETEEQLTTTSSTDNTFDLSIQTGVQSIFDKSVPLNLSITSNITSEKMQVRWTLPSGVKTTGTYTSAWTTISAGDELSTMTKIVPSKPGTYIIVAEVQAWQADANYVDTISVQLTFDNNLEIQPQTEEYYKNQTAWFWAKIGIGVIIATVLGILGWFGFIAFRKWYEKD